MKVKLIAKTSICDEELAQAVGTDPEALIMYCARVSNPNNQTSNNPRLLEYCADHRHWSIFDMADLVFEIETSRAIAAQLLRHKSMFFQEFSQRYAEVTEFEKHDARRQDLKNRQNSIDDLDRETKAWWRQNEDFIQEISLKIYQEALSKGIAKEVARMVLPVSTRTKIYAKMPVRTLIHYIEVRADASTQKEHRDIAEAVREIACRELPNLAKAMKWIDT